MLLRVRPSGEQFEDRLVPDMYVWNMDQGYLSSNNPEYWRVDGEQPDDAPGPDDTLLFDGAHDASVKMLTPEVAGIEIRAGYEGVIDLANENGEKYHSFEVTGSFKMTGGKIQDINFSTGTENANLLLTEESDFTWTAGEIAKVNISLGASDNHDVTGSISGTVTLYDSSLDNYGTLTASGTVNSGLGVYNFVTNRAGGTFEAKTGFNLQDPDGWLKNEGLLRFTPTGTAVVNSRFYNNGGTVRVESGTAQFHQLAEQTGGTFELHDGATAKLAGTGSVLNVLGGSVIGHGVIDGNLAMSGTALINPGFESGFPLLYTHGTLTITQALQMQSDNNQMRIDVTASGFDRVVVTGQATLKGSLTVNTSPTYHPSHPTSHAFLTAAGFGGTDFGTKTLTYVGCWMDPGGSGKMVHWGLPAPTGNTYSLVTMVSGC